LDGCEAASTQERYRFSARVRFYTTNRLLNITESEARRLAETMNKPVDTPSTPKIVSNKK